MGANIAGIYGAQIFRADDKPLYKRGFTIAISVLAVGLVLAVVRYIDGVLRHRRNSGNLQAESTISDHNSQDDEKAQASLPGDKLPQTISIDNGSKPIVSTAERK